ncbi:MAG: chemotaxis protein CheD [Bdellovibrionales bacterium]|nr:chemotaxis protein CheD [Bdellovibrionales bacterium]
MADAKQTNVGIAEMAISDDPEMTLAAAHLGSCLGIAVFDPHKRVGGMIHCLLPLSKSDPAKAEARPQMYVDTGVALLLDKILSGGSRKQDLQIFVAGGAEINDTAHVFEIGKKNVTVLRKILWKNNLLIKAQDVGGSNARTISLQVGSGEVWLRCQGAQVRME